MKSAARSRSWILFSAAALLMGCQANSTPQQGMFTATAMRVHPIFTQVSSWTNSGKPDGIEAQLEFTDQFGDPTKATGKVLFELFGYRNDSPDPRGPRVNRWPGSLVTLDEQRDRWNKVLWTYRFQLEDPQILTTNSYVLTATFEPTSGGRFFDQIVLQGHTPEKAKKKPEVEP